MIESIIIKWYLYTAFLNIIQNFFFQASGFRNMEDYDWFDKDGVRLFRVRGTCPEDVMTTQIQPEEARNFDHL